MSAPAEQRSLVRLAIQEGHDADIPSNDGVVSGNAAEEAARSFRSSPTSLFEKDVEKEAGGPESRPSSSPSVKGPEATPPAAVGDAAAPTNEVWWDGDHDPENPMNWSLFRKWGTVALVSGLTFLTPLGSSIFAPSIPTVMAEFGSNSELLSGFVVSVYVLGFAFGPLVIAPMSEMYGRLALYHSCGVLFLLCNVACALSKSLNMLIAFRFLAGCVGASPLTLGGGTIADLMTARQRATAISIWVMGPTIGPVLGPIMGAFISDRVGWRWNFWVLAIATGVFTIFGVILMRETYAPTILERRAKKLQRETGNTALKSKLDIGLTAKDLFWFSIMRPTKMLLFSPIVLWLSVYVAIAYAYLYIFFTTITQVFETIYHFKDELVGLSFIGIGVGQFAGQFVYSYLAGRSYKKHTKLGDQRPEQRLHLMLIGAAVIPIGLFWYGWSIQAKAHWINPVIAAGVFSFGLLFIWLPSNIYLIDVFTVYAASAMAANTVLRSAVAAVLPLAGPKMYAAMGYGWGNSLLGFVALLMFPIPLFFIRYGERMRKNSTLKL